MIGVVPLCLSLVQVIPAQPVLRRVYCAPVDASYCDKYWIDGPATVSGPQYPLIVMFHGHGETHDPATWIQGAAAFMRSATSVVIDGEQREAQSMTVSEEYVDVAGAAPIIGRGIRTGDDSSAAEPPAVLSYSFWQSGLSGDRDVIGRRLNIGGLEYSVAGVMPQGFSGHSPIDTDV
jgi:hypothetical protein